MAGSGLPRNALIAEALKTTGVRFVVDGRSTRRGRPPRPDEILVRRSGIDSASTADHIDAVAGSWPLVLIAADGTAWILDEWAADIVVAGTGDPNEAQAATLEILLRLFDGGLKRTRRRVKPTEDEIVETLEGDETESVEEASDD